MQKSSSLCVPVHLEARFIASLNGNDKHIVQDTFRQKANFSDGVIDGTHIHIIAQEEHNSENCSHKPQRIIFHTMRYVEKT